MIYVQVTGDRNWRDAMVIDDILWQIFLIKDIKVTLRSGDAQGADIISDVCAQFNNWKIERYPANWKEHGRAAGPIRNQLMVDQEPKADLALAFHSNLAKSRGTKDMVERLAAYDIPVFLFTGVGDEVILDRLREFVERL